MQNIKIEEITKTLVIVAGILGLALLAFVRANDYIDLRSNIARYEAIDNCIKASSMVTTHKSESRDSTTTEPIRDIYNYCLNDKGIEVNK